VIRRILRSLIPIGVVVVLATLGYTLIWGWGFIDALYMTVITVATVGYREVRPLTPAGQLFTIVVIASGVAAGGFALTRIVNLLLEQQFRGLWEARRMIKRIDALSGHTVIAGMGRVGSVVAGELVAQQAPFVVVDVGQEGVDVAAREGWLYIQGDATEESVLRDAGLMRAGSLVTALDSDAENLFVTVTARALNPDVFIVARSSHASTEQKLLKAGANRVITPNVIGGRRMATMVLHPTVSDYLDLVTHGSGVEFQLQEVIVAEGSALDGHSIAESKVREATGAYILAVRHRDGRLDSNPASEFGIHAGDHLVVLGTGPQVERLSSIAGR
jgi:voltage-gated potassium channel